MDANTKKTTLRMIPYGLYVLTAGTREGKIAGATVTWVTQASFEPARVLVCVKPDSFIHAVIEEAQSFALNILGKGQASLAYTFFKPTGREGNTISGEPFTEGVTGSPILENTAAFVECRLVESIKAGDHTVFIGEVVEAGLRKPLVGRPDETTLWLKDLGEKLFYGG